MQKSTIWATSNQVARLSRNFARAFSRQGFRQPKTLVLIASICLAMAGEMAKSAVAASLPCDIFASAGTPCVAAYSTARALFSAYNGALYQVQRTSDSTFLTISTLSAGGYATAAAQDSFCSDTVCLITEIYDQTSNHNNLTIEGAGGNGAADFGAPANSLAVTAGGNKVYGVSINRNTGYRNDSTTGVAKSGAAEGMYMVTSGIHFNTSCCFDFGNAETDNDDNGDGHMDAINFGNECWFSPCDGTGPWVQADMENGLFESNEGSSLNSSNTGLTSSFVTAVLRNNGSTEMSLSGGNAQSGALTKFYDGGLPSGYSPMKQEGAVVLGTGGDDSNGSIGSFFEGVMTSGYPSDTTMNSIQSNIVSIGYTMTVPTTGSFTELINDNSGMCLSAVNTTEGTQLEQTTCTGSTLQEWDVTNEGAGYYLTNEDTGMVADDSGFSTTAGGAVIDWDKNGGENQEWQFTPSGISGYFNIVNVNSGLCLDVFGDSKTSGAVIDQWYCNGGFNQLWKQ